MKKLIVIFGIMIITLACGITAFASETDDTGMWEYQIIGEGVELTGYCGSNEDVYIPNEVTKGENEFPVLKLGDNLFKGNTALNSVTLGEGITEIGDSAFEGAENLTCIVTPESLTTIGKRAFAGCTNFNSVILYDGVTAIGENAFEGCEKVVIYCDSFISVAFKYSEDNGINAELIDENKIPKTVVDGDFVFYIANGDAVLMEYTGTEKNVVIPATVNGCHVSVINEKFSMAEFVSIPDTVKKIPDFNASTVPCISRNSYVYDFLSSNDKQYFVVNYGIFPEVLTDGIFTYYIVNNDYAVLKKCDNLAEGEINLPDNINGIPVTKIFGGAFASSRGSKIILPDTITDIFSNAFSNCMYLESVNIPPGVEVLRRDTFFRCESAKVSLNNNLRKIQTYAFSEIDSLILPDNSMLEMEDSSVISVKNITIPPNVSFINDNAFSDPNNDCKTLFYVSDNSYGKEWVKDNHYLYCETGEELYYSSFGGETDLYSYSIGCVFIDDYAVITSISAQKNYEEADVDIIELVIPDYIDGRLVTEISGYLDCIFDYDWNNEENNIKVKLTLPESISYIGKNAFSQFSNLVGINIPYEVKTIEDSTFCYCENLKDVVLHDGIVSIGSNAFSNTAIEAIEFYDSLLSIGDGAFANSALKEVIYPDIEKMGICVFEGCNNLKTVTVERGVKEITERAFGMCKNLESVYIPSTVKDFGFNAFWCCPKLILISDSNSDNYNQPTYKYAKENGILYNNKFFESSIIRHEYTQDGITYYLVYNNWNYIMYDMTNSDAIVLSYDFENRSEEKVVIPEEIHAFDRVWDVSKIGDKAFSTYFSKKLKEVVLPESIRIIGDQAFNGTPVKINIPDKVSHIGSTALTYSQIPEVFTFPLKKVGGAAFFGTKVKKVIFPEGVKVIPQYVFEHCYNLEEVLLPESLELIEERAFSATSIKNLIIPAKVKIEDNAFGISNLERLIFTDGVTEISKNFNDGAKLRMVYLPKSISFIDYEAFSNCPKAIFCVYRDTYAHEYCINRGLPYFVIPDNQNPEIAYGSAIAGTLTYTDGTASAGATVDILYDDGTVKESVVCDEYGDYEFTYAEVGRYTIRVTDKDGNTASEIVSVKRMNVFDVYVAGETDLVLRKGYSVSGNVSALEAKVTLSDTKGNVIKAIYITDGVFCFDDVPRGSYIVKAESENGSGMLEIYVSNEDIEGLYLEIFAQSATVKGDVKIENRDGSLSSKNWINVDLIDSDGNVVFHTLTDAEGNYTFKNIPLGSYNIVATTNVMRPDITGAFDKNHELKGYGRVEITELGEIAVPTIILREDKVDKKATVSGKVTANGITQDCRVILTNENGDQLAVFVTDNNGKYSFVNIPDGMYCITAITKADGMGFAVINVENGVVHGNTDIKVAKADKISKREETLLSIPDCSKKEEALVYKEVVLAEKAFYDNLSEKERKQLSQSWIDKLFALITMISDNTVTAPDGVRVENEESVISPDEIGEKISFVLEVCEVSAKDADADGITTGEEYETEKIKEKGKGKKIAKYYDITFSKDGKNISNIRKQTETNGKLRITMDIPENMRGHKHYTFIHMHKGEAVTLVDLDDNPNTVTFEIDKFSTFALAYSDEDILGEIEDSVKVSYNGETEKVSVTATESATMYVATYSEKKLEKVEIYNIPVGVKENICTLGENQAIFVWNENSQPLCEKFTLNK